MADYTALRIEDMEHAFGGAFVRVDDRLPRHRFPLIMGLLGGKTIQKLGRTSAR